LNRLVSTVMRIEAAFDKAGILFITDDESPESVFG
jgi:hypothetical protein